MRANKRGEHRSVGELGDAGQMTKAAAAQKNLGHMTWDNAPDEEQDAQTPNVAHGRVHAHVLKDFWSYRSKMGRDRRFMAAQHECYRPAERKKKSEAMGATLVAVPVKAGVPHSCVMSSERFFCALRPKSERQTSHSSSSEGS